MRIALDVNGQWVPLNTDESGNLKVSLASDVQIGSVEIKNATDDTRATVGANGLHVDVRNIQAGTAILGKVGIDQTTPGTTNGVQVNAALPAGANVIGSVKISPVAATILASGTKAASGDQALIAAPAAGNHLVVCKIQIQLEAAVETTVILKVGAAEAWRALLTAKGAALNLDFPPGQEWNLATATALTLSLSGANSCGYAIQYRTEAD
jgi:hypothetical protein